MLSTCEGILFAVSAIVKAWPWTSEAFPQDAADACRSVGQQSVGQGLADMVDVVTGEIPDEALDTPSRIHVQYASLFDHATGLPGWPVLIDRTQMALARAAQHDLRVAVMVFDDVRRGSSVSADFNTCVAGLRNAVFADDTVARIGGRTFVLVLNDVRSAETLASTANEMVEGLGLSCHIGLAIGSPPCDPEALINQARRDALPPPPPPPAPRWDDQYRLDESA